jgi:hypothetical protein
MIRKTKSITILLFVICLLVRSVLLNQAMSQSPEGLKHLKPRAETQTRPVSLPHLYWHFLLYQHHLDQLAVEHEKQGKDGGWLRTYLQTKLSMTDTEFQPIRESADRLDSETTALNAKAHATVAAARAAISKDGSASTGAEQARRDLQNLTAERETAINAEIDTLNASLGPEAAAVLKHYITNDFSKTVSIVRVDPATAKARKFGPRVGTDKEQP